MGDGDEDYEERGGDSDDGDDGDDDDEADGCDAPTRQKAEGMRLHH